MKLDIVHTDKTLTVQGQAVTKAYAEGVMLAGLIAAVGKNHGAITSIIKQYIEAGLSTASFPEQTAVARDEIAAAKEHERKRQQESHWHAERFASYQAPTRLEVARAREAKEKQAAAIREHGNAIRAARRH